MLKKNCHQVLGSQKSKLTPPELVFQTAGAINPPPIKIGLKLTKSCQYTICWRKCQFHLFGKSIGIYSKFEVGRSNVRIFPVNLTELYKL